MPIKSKEHKKAVSAAYHARPEVKERTNAQYRERYANGGKEKKKEYDRQRRQSPEYKAARASYMLERRQLQWSKTKLIEIKAKCKKYGIPFDLTEDDLVMPEFCPIFGIKLHVGVGKQTNNSPSIDRVIPELGYVKGNVVVVSNRANSLKKSASLSELVSMVQFYWNFLNATKEK